MIHLVTLLVLSGAPKLVAAPTCLIADDMVFFHVEIPIQVTMQGKPTEVLNKLYQLTCDRKTRKCTGVALDLAPQLDEKGNYQITVMGLTGLHGATLQSVVGNVAVISWGIHQFVFDYAAGTITKSAQTAEGSSERGTGDCSPSRKKANLAR